jgi:hypothetical protein
MKKAVKLPKSRNPVAKNMHKVTRPVVVPAKKGRGSVYRRNQLPKQDVE